MRRLILLLTVLLIATALTQAQVKTVAQYIAQVEALSNRADLKAANDYLERNHESIVREWIAITEINAPSGQEQQRAKYIEGLLRKYDLDDVHYDSAGNLIAVRKGAGGGPVIVFDATGYRFPTWVADQGNHSRWQDLRARHWRRHAQYRSAAGDHSGPERRQDQD